MYQMAYNPGVRDYLIKIGADPEVIEFIDGIEDTKVQGKLANEVRKSPRITFKQIQSLVPQTSKDALPTYDEAMFLDDAFSGRGFGGSIIPWLLVQFKKWRWKKQKETRPVPNLVRSHGTGLMRYILDHFELSDYVYSYMEDKVHPDEDQEFVMSPDSSVGLIDSITTIYDWFVATDANLASYTFRQAWNAAEDWHDELRKQAMIRKSQYKHRDVVYPPEGADWKLPNMTGWTVQLVREDDLGVEGDKMGHCVGTYCGRVSAGETSIYSLRDPENYPHVTIEINPKTRDLRQVKGHENSVPPLEHRKAVREWLYATKAVIKEVDLSVRNMYICNPEEFLQLLDVILETEPTVTSHDYVFTFNYKPEYVQHIGGNDSTWSLTDYFPAVYHLHLQRDRKGKTSRDYGQKFMYVALLQFSINHRDWDEYGEAEAYDVADKLWKFVTTYYDVDDGINDIITARQAMLFGTYPSNIPAIKAALKLQVDLTGFSPNDYKFEKYVVKRLMEHVERSRTA